MLLAAFIALAVLSLSVAVVLYLIRRAPEGQEGARGFQYTAMEPAPVPPVRPEPKASGPEVLKAPAI